MHRRNSLIAFLLVALTFSAVGQTSPLPLPREPGDYKLKFVNRVDGKPVQLAYLLSLPKGYDTGKGPFPVLCFLHGAGEAGIDLTAIYAHGPNRTLQDPKFAAMKESFPFIVVSPQCPPRGERWDQPPMYQSAVAILNDLSAKLPKFDRDRVYVTGLSMGGKGSWFVTEDAPGLIAAVAPISAVAIRPEMCPRMGNVNVWLLSGADDKESVDGALAMASGLRQVGNEPKSTVLPGVGHDAWQTFYDSAQFYEWLLEHRRLAPALRKTKLAELTRPATPTQGHHLGQFVTQLKNQNAQVDYTIYLPKGYNAAGEVKPLLVSLHEYDRIGDVVNDMCLHGIDVELAKKENAAFRDNFPFIVLSPKCPPGLGHWDQPDTQQAILALIDDVCKKYRVDKTRIYLTGVNEGGLGAWQLAAAAPAKFAAIAPVMGDGPCNLAANTIDALKTTPIWFSFSDPERLKALANDFKAAPNCKFASIDKKPAAELSGVFRNAELYAWMLKQKKLK